MNDIVLRRYRLKVLALQMAYKACLDDVIRFNELLGNAMTLSHPSSLNLTSYFSQR